MKKQAQVSIQDMEENCDKAAGLMKALGHPRRLMILCHLSTGEKTVGELESLGGASQSSVSQYLNRMRLEGLVSSEKRGLFVYYQIKDLKVKKLINALHKMFC